jgi:hypothetical protein
MAKVQKITWKKRLGKKEIEASETFLHLIFEDEEVARAVKELRKHRDRVEGFMVRDILRASQNELKPETNENVQKQFVKMFYGEPVAPIALVRKDQKLFIADGYHRMCATYYLDKDCEIRGVLVGI